MIREYKKIAGMTDKEIMYVVASEYIDDICMQLVEKAPEIMDNDIIRTLICRAAENILRYEERRKEIALGKEESDCFYEFLMNDIRAYKTVLYDTIFHEYGKNESNL